MLRAARQPWDVAYEWRAVILLTIGFGLVGLDRWVVADLAALKSSTMVADLRLTPQQLGNVVAALGIGWGVSSLVMGRLSDAFGRKRILVPALVLFSIMSWMSGWVGGVGGLLAVRVLMGVFEGAFCPASFAAVAEASHPKRRGFNLGFQQSAFALLGLGFGPIITSYLLLETSWRWVFAIVGLPGLVIALLVARTIREPAKDDAPPVPHRPVRKGSLLEMFAHRNLALAMVGQLCAMSGIFVISAFVPSYLTVYLKLDDHRAALIVSAIGFGGFVGQWGLPAVSDFLGRRPMALAGFSISAVFLLIFTQLTRQTDGLLMFAILFVTAVFAFGLLSLISGPIATEAAPAGKIATAVGLVAATAEIFGGGLSPSLSGYIAEHYGLPSVLWLALGGLVTGVFVSLFFQETAPRFAKAGEGVESALDYYEDQHGSAVSPVTDR